MAIKLEDKTNVLPPDSTYPYGDILDDTGIGDGTPVSREVYADFHQFFAKMLAESGITANGLADNATNGFQYWDALAKFCFIGSWTSVAVSPTVPTGSITVIGGTNFNTFKQVGNTLFWNVVFSCSVTGSPSEIKINIPAGVVYGGSGMQIGLRIICMVDGEVGFAQVGSGADGSFVRVFRMDGGDIAGGNVSLSITTRLI